MKTTNEARFFVNLPIYARLSPPRLITELKRLEKSHDHSAHRSFHPMAIDCRGTSTLINHVAPTSIIPRSTRPVAGSLSKLRWTFLRGNHVPMTPMWSTHCPHRSCHNCQPTIEKTVYLGRSNGTGTYRRFIIKRSQRGARPTRYLERPVNCKTSS